MNPEIEERIEMEIIVDCYDSHEAAMGWYCYLEDRLYFPFEAISTQGKSKLTVLGLADSEHCLGHMFVVAQPA